MTSTAVLPGHVETGAKPRPTKLPSLTGMRFIAAMLVFGFHAAWQFLFVNPDSQNTIFSIFSQGGWTGVGFFFVLSGFVLTWSARPTDRVTTFWRRRALKIWPNHLVTLVVAAILASTVLNVTLDREHGLWNVLLIHSWFPDMATRHDYNPVAWSLSVEALFYLSFPLLLLLVNKIRPERLWAWAGACVAVILAIPAVANLLPEQPRFPVTNFTQWEMWFIYEFPPTRLPEFLFGMLLAKIVLSGRKLPLNLGGAVALAVLGYFLAPLFPRNYNLIAVMVVPLGLVIAAGAVADVEGRPTFLSNRVMIWLGEVSFAFYLWQYTVLTYGHHWLGGEKKAYGTITALGVLGLLFLVTLTLAWLLFSLVERPLMRKFGRPKKSRTSGPTIPATPSAKPPVGAAPVA